MIDAVVQGPKTEIEYKITRRREIYKASACQFSVSNVSIQHPLKITAPPVSIAILKLHSDPVSPQAQQIRLGGTKSHTVELPKMGDDLVYVDENLLLAIHDEKSFDSVPRFSLGVIEFIERPVNGSGEFIGSLVEWVARVGIDEDVAFLTFGWFFFCEVFKI